MKCSRAKTLLNLYVDGRLPLRRFAALEDHLRGCDACHEELAHLELVTRSLAETPLIAEPERLTSLILARIAGYEAKRTRARERAFAPRWGDAVLAAVLASLTTLLFVFLDPHLRPGILSGMASFVGQLSSLASAPGNGASAWLVWMIWIGAGCVLTLWLAGAQLRSSWRRSLAQRIPQLRQPG
jgi:anti-sigma factor RsiW